jgi:hypothetical protein
LKRWNLREVSKRILEGRDQESFSLGAAALITIHDHEHDAPAEDRETGLVP